MYTLRAKGCDFILKNGDDEINIGDYVEGYFISLPRVDGHYLIRQMVLSFSNLQDPRHVELSVNKGCTTMGRNLANGIPFKIVIRRFINAHYAEMTTLITHSRVREAK